MATNHPTNVWLHQITNKRIMITDGDLLMICYHHYNILQLWCLHVPCGCFSQRLRVLSAVSRDRNFCGVAVEPAPRITVYPRGNYRAARVFSPWKNAGKCGEIIHQWRFYMLLPQKNTRKKWPFQWDRWIVEVADFPAMLNDQMATWLIRAVYGWDWSHSL